MPNSWLQHVKATKAKHPAWSLKDVLKAASKTYKRKPLKGGSAMKNVRRSPAGFSTMPVGYSYQ